MSLEEEDYTAAVERAGVRELPDDWEAEAEAGTDSGPGPLPAEVSSGRWVDDDPPGCPR
ncbi:MAG TPA: hypothetical protein VIR27_00960 [Mycobacteriales bacterium]